MKNVYGILDLHNGPSLGALTEGHPLGSVSFLGRYGIMDFALSNLSNSGIDRIAILIENNSHSIRSHIQGGRIWINNTRTGDLGEYLNESALSTPKFNTDIANIKTSLSPIDKQIVEDYVIIVPPHFIMSMDYHPAVEQHAASGADITIIYSSRNDADEDFVNCDALKIDKDGNVTDMYTNAGRKPEKNISLDTYIINKAKLIEIVNETKMVSSLYSLRDMVRYYIENKKAVVKSYRFKGVVLPITSLNNYVKYSFECLKPDVAYGIFKKEWPIYTTTHNTPPAIYGPNAEVKNSIISNGCKINGKVENSIISRNVVVEEGAVVKDSIIFTKSFIKSGVKARHVLCGKHVSMEMKNDISGTDKEMLFIDYGEKI